MIVTVLDMVIVIHRKSNSSNSSGNGNIGNGSGRNNRDGNRDSTCISGDDSVDGGNVSPQQITYSFGSCHEGLLSPSGF